MKILTKIIAWVFIIVFCLPTFLLIFDYTVYGLNPSSDKYGLLIFTMFFILVILKFVEMIPKFSSPKKKLKIGLDIHGICDANPKFFSELSRLFVNAGHELHIITGRRVCDGALEEVEDLGINYTHFFSIADYHKEIGTKVWEDDNGNPWLEGELWDKTKGEYCKKHKIDLHIDDTERYGEYFDTPFMLSKIFRRAE